MHGKMGLLAFCSELSNNVFFKDNACCLSEYQSNNAWQLTFVTSTMRRAIGDPEFAHQFGFFTTYSF